MPRILLTLILLASVGACSSLPRDGPSARSIDAGATSSEGVATYAVVDLTYAVTERLRLAPPPFLGSFINHSSEAPIDLIGEGDDLAITIFEPSGSLFGGGSSDRRTASGANQTFPVATVDRSGSVSIPFAGPVRVQGMTTNQAAEAIRRSLRGRVANPQVLVTIAANRSNAVTVLGEVRTPGRVPVAANADRLLEVLAAAGGTSRPVDDIEVVITRGAQTARAPLRAVTTQFQENVRLAPGDQVNFEYRPRRFSNFGALGAVSQLTFEGGELTLAGALSRAGGLDNESANARSVLVFRFERPEVAQMLGISGPLTPRGVPVIYRLNLADPSGFFIANSFLIEPDDIIYGPRANTAELRKFFELVQSITRVVYDVTVTGALNTN